MLATEYFKDYDPAYVEMFAEMCKRVGITLGGLELIPYGDKWEWPYAAYAWTEAEEDEYRKWLVDYVYKNRRKFGYSYAKKKWIKDRVVPYFLLQYSWKYAKEK